MGIIPVQTLPFTVWWTFSGKYKVVLPFHEGRKDIVHTKFLIYDSFVTGRTLGQAL
jgi:hypothetical protein